MQNGNDFINVRVEKLDELQNLTGELIIAASSWLEASKGSVEDGRNHQVGRFLKELEELVISIRMVPFSNVVPQLGRIVRDICKKEKKEVSFHVQGQNVEVDKKIADGILDPLLHLIRNAIDHGIEQPEEREKAGKPRAGSVTLLFANVGGEIVVSVSDDGCGIDLEQVRKIENQQEVKHQQQTTGIKSCEVQCSNRRSVADAENGQHNAPLNLSNTVQEAVGIFGQGHNDRQSQEQVDRDEQREESDLFISQKDVLNGNRDIKRNDQDDVVMAPGRSQCNKFAQSKE